MIVSSRLRPQTYLVLGLLAIAASFLILAALYLALAPAACGCAATPLPS